MYVGRICAQECTQNTHTHVSNFSFIHALTPVLTNADVPVLTHCVHVHTHSVASYGMGVRSSHPAFGGAQLSRLSWAGPGIPCQALALQEVLFLPSMNTAFSWRRRGTGSLWRTLTYMMRSLVVG